MSPSPIVRRFLLRWSAGLAGLALPLGGAPVVSRLTPPSGLFSYGDEGPPEISRFLPGQRFDLQATVRPDPGQVITRVEFAVDGVVVPGAVTLTPATADGLPAGTTVATLRAASRNTPGVRRLTVRAVQGDGAVGTAAGSFEIVALAAEAGARARNLIIMIGDGMGVAHRTAARVLLHGVSQGKALGTLAMDTLPAAALIRTPSLDSLLTDSAAGAAVYTMGNKAANGHVGVFPDDTKDRFDNPRVELLSEYLARTQGKWLGLVTTADVADATPSAFAAHSQDRQAEAGIVDGYLDEAVAKANLRVVLGGGRRWFLPNTTPGSARVDKYDTVLPAELAEGWGVPPGRIDSGRDLVADFRAAGFTYVANRTQLAALPASTGRLLGLFHLGDLNAALDRVARRRGRSTVVDDFGFPDQPMLDEMTGAALAILKNNPAGFVLLIEGALIDKQSHLMDTERWMHEVIEFDRAVARARAFAQSVPDTLLIVTADHETAGANVIGTLRVTQAQLAARVAAGGGPLRLRDEIVAAAVPAGFPNYRILADGFPDTSDVSRRMVIGYAANADRYEDWQANPKPTGGPAGYPSTPLERDTAGGFLVTGQVPGPFASHTGSDIPLAALGPGSALFAGSLDNTEPFFRMMQLALGGAPVLPGSPSPAPLGGTGQRTAADRLINLSSRGLVGAGESALISGFVLSGTQPHRLLIRGVGPSLAAYGVANALVDPVLRLRNGAGADVAANSDWEANDNIGALREAAAAAGAFALVAGSRDAALLVELAPGSYSVELAGANGAGGVGLLEIYELP